MLPQGLIGKVLCAIIDDFQWVVVDLRGHELFTTTDYTGTTINRLLSPLKGNLIKSVCVWPCQRCLQSSSAGKHIFSKNLAATASTLHAPKTLT